VLLFKDSVSSNLQRLASSDAYSNAKDKQIVSKNAVNNKRESFEELLRFSATKVEKSAPSICNYEQSKDSGINRDLTEYSRIQDSQPLESPNSSPGILNIGRRVAVENVRGNNDPNFLSRHILSQPETPISNLGASVLSTVNMALAVKSMSPREGGITTMSAPHILSLERSAQPNLLSVTRTFQEPDKLQVRAIVEDALNKHGIDSSLGLAVAQAESDFKPDAVSNDGHKSKGVFQLLDSTAKDMLSHLEYDPEQAYVPFNPAQNADLGAGYLKTLLSAFQTGSFMGKAFPVIPAQTGEDTEKLAVAAYNAGIGTLQQAQKTASENGKNGGVYTDVKRFIPESTVSYVDKVWKLRELNQQSNASSNVDFYAQS